MVLTFEQIRTATLGAARVAEEAGAVRFYRFTAEQQRLYQSYDEKFYQKTFTTAGVKLCFRTDSPWMAIRAEFFQTAPRSYFSLDVTVDGDYTGSIDNFSDKILPEDYTTAVLEMGQFEKQFALGSGLKTVCVYLPWVAATALEELSLADGSFFEPVRPGKTLLMFGDSITQGYDALRPMNRYAAKLARALDAEEFNKAIGGEVFYPPLAEAKDDLTPDYITVAYGTNDWSKKKRPEVLKNARAFYEALCRNYPDAKLFALAPIWRKDRDEYREYGSFDQMREDLRTITADLPVTLIDCYDFVPKDPAFYADLRLHPNDEGFMHYVEHLTQAIRAQL